MTTTRASALQSGEVKSLPLSTATRQTSMVQALHAHSAAAITRSPSAVVYKTSSLRTNHVSLQLAVESQSHLFIVVAPGGPRNLRSSVLVRVSLLPTGVRAVVGVKDITAVVARHLGARSEMTLAGPSNVWVSPLALPLAFILTTSLCPSRGTMLLCARLSKPTVRPPTSSVLQSPLPRARSLWSLLPLSAASSWLLSQIAIS